MTRRVIAIMTLATVSAAFLATQTSAQTGPPKVRDFLRAYSIAPTGEDGNVTADEFAAYQAQGDHAAFGPHFSDQLEPYAALIDDPDVTDADLDKYFHSMQFGPEGDIESTYSPIEGVTVYRDSMGIPHIYADSLKAASFALGYTTAEDRLFQMDVIRHAARGTLAEFVGPSRLQMDIASRREGYTEEEVQAMFDAFDDKFGQDGKTVQEGLQAYADGVTAYIDELKTNPAFFPRRPVEYEATGNPFPEFPQPWTATDTLYVVILQIREFGETAGYELQNSGIYAHLVERLGKKLGPKVFEDLLRRNDPRSPTSIAPNQAKFPSQPLGRTKRASFAIPDNAVELASEAQAALAERNRFLTEIGFPAQAASNALLVSGRESTTGNPLQVGAPQVGYAVPGFFWEVDVHAPGIDFRGPAVPGASALLPLGRGRDYAWTLTTGESDAVDTRVELLCEPGGGEPTVDSNGYMFKGECKEMESRTETFVAKPNPADTGEPTVEQHTFYRTIHGPVFARTTVDKKPVALVKQRFFWKKEVDAIIPFYRWNVETDSVEDFAAAASKHTMSFNAFYADATDIGYFHVGYLPRRAKGVHPALPIWGTGQWEWRKARRPFSSMPKVVNPAQGWVANWNNKPAIGWDNYDDFKWGPVQRVQLLIDHMHKLLDGKGKAELADLVDVIGTAATRDVPASYVGPKMLAWARATVGGNAKAIKAIRLVAEWVGKGAHRENKDRDDKMDNGAALAIWDRWYRGLVHEIFDDELGEKGFELLKGAEDDPRAPLVHYPLNADISSVYYFDFSSYLKNLFSRSAKRAYARDYCDDIESQGPETCKALVATALINALEELAKEQGDNMDKWTTPAENIKWLGLGAGEVPEIPHQNRGVHNQVVEFLRDAGGR